MIKDQAGCREMWRQIIGAMGRAGLSSAAPPAPPLVAGAAGVRLEAAAANVVVGAGWLLGWTQRRAFSRPNADDYLDTSLA
ncbi:MAG: hypothetical protein QOE92_647, partial [Chloroflexota bacterium]|nr:hypothetical protein [Chloroflexota bacterium]